MEKNPQVNANEREWGEGRVVVGGGRCSLPGRTFVGGAWYDW